MQLLEFSGAVRSIYLSLGVKRLLKENRNIYYYCVMEHAVNTKTLKNETHIHTHTRARLIPATCFDISEVILWILL